jgi:hypothetical protein
MTTVRAYERPSRCHLPCSASALHPDHHDRLLRLDVDPDVMLELLEIAVTWHELDYTDVPVLGPAEWLTFAAAHSWIDPDRAERVFALAVDIVGRRAAGPAPDGDTARIFELVRA